MKTWEQILVDNPPFRPDSSTDSKKMRFMFLLENGQLIGDAEGRNHTVLMGWTSEDSDPHQVEQQLCEQNKALRVCYQPFSEKRDGTRGDFWAVYVQIDKVPPNEAQWATLSALYLLNGWRDTVVTWDAHSSEKRKWERSSEGTLADLRRQLFPDPVLPTTENKTKNKMTPKSSVKPR